MRIPKGQLTGFVREISNECFSSRQDRINRGNFFTNYFEAGSEYSSSPALFNKCYESIDDLESLLFSPVSLKFKISDPDIPNQVNIAKGRAAASRLRTYARTSNTDTMISAAVRSAIIKGKAFIKQSYRKDDFKPVLVQPEDMGVLRENVTELDEEMEAFSHTMMITPYQFRRLVKGLPDEKALLEKGENYIQQDKGDGGRSAASKQVTVGGMFPFQAGPSAGGSVSTTRGLVDWLSRPRPNLAPSTEQALMELRETWIWDDEREDWATFQLVGDEMLIMGRYQIINALAYDPATKQSADILKGTHPFREFCINPVDDYFWGASELRHLVGLQESLNSRMVGINKLLRKQEDPTKKFLGTTGVNQVALSRYNKPGGYYVDSSPTAKIETDVITIPQDLWSSSHEYERMFDAIMGLPPVSRGKGESGVRSKSHADTLVRQFSPRFKDRALLVERDVEALGGLMLDMAKAHDANKLYAWVEEKAAGLEGSKPDELMVAPAPGLVPVFFKFGDLPDNVSLLVDSHSSSPAFSQDEKGLHFDLVKVGAEDPEELVEHVDVQNPDELQMGIRRRAIAKAEAEAKEKDEEMAVRMFGGGRKR